MIKGVFNMKRNKINTKVIATIMAAFCAVSAATAISTASVSAAQTSEAVSAPAAKSCSISFSGKTSYGYDWDYRADSSAAKIKCTYDFSTGKYTFRATGSYEGVTNAVIKYATIDGKWHNVPIRYTVDSGLNVTGRQTGREYVTDTRYE